jgi:LysM repeat protein
MSRLLFVFVAIALVALSVVPLRAQGSTTYVVQPGDNLYRIAARFGVSVAALQQANGIANPNLIFVGQVLLIPTAANTLSSAPISIRITPGANNRPPSSGDGRINLIPWVNSFGAIAVYCVDEFDMPGGAFNKGGIKVLSNTGQRLFFAPELTIIPARIKANQSRVPVLILSGPIYTLYALPGGYFQLNSRPDAEGKVFLGRWKDCIPVGPGPATQPTLVPTPTSPNCIDCIANLVRGPG